MKQTIKMLHSSFSTDGLLIGQGGKSLDFPCIIFVDVDGRQAKSTVHLSTQVALWKSHGNPLSAVSISSVLFIHPDWTNVFKEFRHLLHLRLLSQACDVDCAVLRVILLFRTSYKYIKKIQNWCQIQLRYISLTYCKAIGMRTSTHPCRAHLHPWVLWSSYWKDNKWRKVSVWNWGSTCGVLQR